MAEPDEQIELVLPPRWRALPKSMAYPPGRFKPVGDCLNFTQEQRWYNRALSYRYEMGSLRTSLRYNRLCLAAFLRLHRGESLLRLSTGCARAGMERAVWEITGKQIKLARRYVRR